MRNTGSSYSTSLDVAALMAPEVESDGRPFTFRSLWEAVETVGFTIFLGALTIVFLIGGMQLAALLDH